jgi:hypothetical protein
MGDKWRRDKQKRPSKDVETVEPSSERRNRLSEKKASKLESKGDRLFTPTQAELSRRKEEQYSGSGACCTIS